MAPLLIFAAFVGMACMVALTDWRRAWLLAVVVGVLQDPARKLTAGMPVFMTFSIVAVYFMILFATQQRLQAAARDFTRRFSQVWVAFGVLLLFLVLAAVNGMVTFGLAQWKAPLLSFFTYMAPLPAILLGYLYVDREERLYRFMMFYAILTSVALIGSPLEYYRVDLPVLGMVRQVGDYIRFLPGIELRMISGFYRAPDIMGWHAAMLTAIAIGMITRAEMKRTAWPWMFAAGWGFYNCMISGRRKAVYMVLVFTAAFLWRYFRRLKPAQLAAFAMCALAIFFVVHRMSKDEQASAYTRGAIATEEEVEQRLEGGLFATIDQAGIMGAGLGTATQGVQHLLTGNETVSWQEGGLGKLAIELGVPGLIGAAFFGFTVLLALYRISGIPDHWSTSQVMRATLFGLVIANVGNFMASAQAYSDPVLTILTCFFLGSLFATVTLDERAPAAPPEPASTAPLVYAAQA
jgi:hypothetical protein